MRRVVRWILLSALIAFAAACSREGAPVADPLASGELVVLVRAAPNELDDSDTPGLIAFETDLVQAFARARNLKVRFQRVADYDQAADLLQRAQAHMAIGSITPDWPAKVRFSVPIHRLRYVFVDHEGRNANALAGRSVGVVPNSPCAEIGRRVLRDEPTMSVLESRAADDMTLLRQVAVRKLDVALTDDLHFAIASRYAPGLRVLREHPEKSNLVWAFPPGPSNAFMPEVDAFLTRARNSGLIDRLMDRYASSTHALDDDDITTFIERMHHVLPKFREHFFAADRETGLDWRFLAALAYQESHWDPLATSPTGVRGIMMLTAETADRLQVQDRLDPEQSIRAGARYFNELRELLPRDVEEPDRTWLTLASYNIGPGHMKGAIEIARNMRHDVRSWADMKRVLPLLATPEYAARLKSGAARGGEAVSMAEKVRTYFDILRHFQKPYASFIGPRDRSLLAGNETPPALRPKLSPKPAAGAAVVSKKLAEPILPAPPSPPKPEASPAAEPAEPAPPKTDQDAAGTSASKPPM